ncbi:hypothetical protein U6X50_12185, partial [Cutibacterium acnes]
TTLITESEEELKSLLMRVKDKTERADFKLNIKKKKKKIMGIRPQYFMAKRGGRKWQFSPYWALKSLDCDCSLEIR